MYKIAVIPGDGIGCEVVPEAVRVLESTGLSFDFQSLHVGYDVWKKTGNSVPDEVIEDIKKNRATLFGATTTPLGVANYKSAIVTLRKALDLYANIRPSKTYPVKGCRENVDLVVVRENTEGLYSGIEFGSDDSAYTVRVITRKASERIARYAYNLARKRRKKVTVVTKTNILRLTCGLFRDTCFKVAKEYPDIETNELFVDVAAMNLVLKPQTFDVIVTTNMFGDILSDEAAGLICGLGLAPSANIGENHALFEPVHGSAPDIAGKRIANPIAAILSAKMMLDYLHEEAWAKRLEEAVINVLRNGKHFTPDLGGHSGTKELTNEIISTLVAL